MNTRDEDTGVYAVIIETKTQAPILLETEGDRSSYGSAHERMKQQIKRPDVIRAGVVRLEGSGVWGGNASLLRSMENMQERD